MTAQLKIAAIAPAPKPDDIGVLRSDGYLVPNAVLQQIGDGSVQEGRRHVRMMLADERDHTPDERPASYPTNVRVANEDDEEGLLDLLEAHCRREAPKWAPVSRERIAETIRTATQRKLGIAGVIYAQGKIVAAVVLVPAKPNFCNQYYIHQAFHVVAPEHRRTRYAEDLLTFAKWVSDTWSSKYGYTVHLVYTVEARTKVREKIRFFRRRLTPAGAIFVYPSVKD
jgi:hypothetical protein